MNRIHFRNLYGNYRIVDGDSVQQMQSIFFTVFPQSPSPINHFSAFCLYLTDFDW